MAPIPITKFNPETNFRSEQSTFPMGIPIQNQNSHKNFYQNSLGIKKDSRFGGIRQVAFNKLNHLNFAQFGFCFQKIMNAKFGKLFLTSETQFKTRLVAFEKTPIVLVSEIQNDRYFVLEYAN